MLAIGLVVDDAIVVVEGVERHIEEGMTPKDAALKAMEELSGPVVGIALVLSAVFVPTAFIPGITGKLYQQFAVTIAISVLLSAFNALTLSPALAALLLRPKEPSRGLLRRFFDWFNRVFERATEGYVRWSAVLVRKTVVVLVLLLVFCVAGGFFASRIPSSFPPGRRSRLRLRQCAAAEWGFSGTHHGCHSGCGKNPDGYAGGRTRYHASSASVCSVLSAPVTTPLFL